MYKRSKWDEYPIIHLYGADVGCKCDYEIGLGEGGFSIWKFDTPSQGKFVAENIDDISTALRTLAALIDEEGSNT